MGDLHQWSSPGPATKKSVVESDASLHCIQFFREYSHETVVSCSSYGGSRRPRQSIMKIDNLSELDTIARVHTILASVPNYIRTAVLRNMTIQCIQHDVTQRCALHNTLVLPNITSQDAPALYSYTLSPYLFHSVPYETWPSVVGVYASLPGSVSPVLSAVA